MFNKSIKPLIFALALLLLSIALVAYLWQSLDTKGNVVLENMIAIRDRDEIEQRYEELRSELSASKTEREELREMVLDGDAGTVAFLTQFETLAINVGVNLVTKQLTVINTEEAGFDELKVDFTLSGQEKKVMKMVQLIELMPYNGRLTSLTMQRTTDPATGAGHVSATVSLLVSIFEN